MHALCVSRHADRRADSAQRFLPCILCHTAARPGYHCHISARTQGDRVPSRRRVCGAAGRTRGTVLVQCWHVDCSDWYIDQRLHFLVCFALLRHSTSSANPRAGRNWAATRVRSDCSTSMDSLRALSSKWSAASALVSFTRRTGECTQRRKNRIRCVGKCGSIWVHAGSCTLWCFSCV